MPAELAVDTASVAQHKAISFYLIYGTDDYQSLKDKIERTTKKVEEMNSKKEELLKDINKAKLKKLQSDEDYLKKHTRCVLTSLRNFIPMQCSSAVVPLFLHASTIMCVVAVAGRQ